MYEYNSMGWTGGFTIPGQEPRFSQQTCSGPVADPMDPSSDLVCGMSAEVNFLQGRGCKPVGFQGSHHCLTDAGNQGIFFCCPPGALSAGAQLASGISMPLVLGIASAGALAAFVYWQWRKEQ